jgi:hypothetical protein
MPDNTPKCTCRVNISLFLRPHVGLISCPLHSAAEDLYAALSFTDILLEFMLEKTAQMPPKLTESFRQSHSKASAALLKARGGVDAR